MACTARKTIVWQASMPLIYGSLNLRKKLCDVNALNSKTLATTKQDCTLNI